MMTTNETKGFYKLSWLQRIGFGSGDLAQNLIFQVICTYLLFFYTDIYGLTPSAVAVMFLVGNVANVIGTPSWARSLTRATRATENTARTCSMWAYRFRASPSCASITVLRRR